MTVSLDAAALRTAVVGPGRPWVEVEHHRTIGSTNVRATQIGEPWRVVVADHQSQGRGRLARRWEAPPGTSLAVSATLPAPGSGQGWLPLSAGLAVVAAVEAETTLTAELKWPNDVLLPADGSRKVCGILCEVVAGSSAPLVVVGAGVNISQTRDELPVPTATSLALAGAPGVDLVALVATYLGRLADLHGEPPADLRAAYRSRCATIGRPVALTLPDGRTLSGLAEDVDDDGRLVVSTAAGRTAWAAGDVVHAGSAFSAGPVGPDG